MDEELNKFLKELVDKEIDIVIIHHVEGIHLRTGGILKEVTEDLIKLEVEWRYRWWQKKRKGLYVVNRKTCSILSIFVASLPKNRAA